MTELEPLLDVRELAALVGWSAKTVLNRRSQGLSLPIATKVGARVMFDPEDVRRWLEGLREEASS